MIKKFILLIILLILFPINVIASVEAEINPDWIEYMKLSQEEKNKIEVIPSKYIYEYVSNEIDNVLTGGIEYPTLDGDSNNYVDDNYFSLKNVDGKNYSNSKYKEQRILGLCWAFASIGSVETNMLLNGVKGIEDMIDKCDETNAPDSIYCQYKKDVETNEKYKIGEVLDNVTFSERLIDYMVSYPKDSLTYGQSQERIDVIYERYNPYHLRTSIEKWGDGFNFDDVAKLFSIGLAPRRQLNDWEKYTITYDTKTLEQVFDSVENMYQVTDFYQYPDTPEDKVDLEKWIEGLKKLISEYGSAYVSTTAPSSDSGACYKYPVINQGNSDSVYCGAPHAMQIIGWDDDYSYSYCKMVKYDKENYTKDTCENEKKKWDNVKGCRIIFTTLNRSDYTKEICENDGYEWISGKGVWILKNSWGAYVDEKKMYPYLAYTSRTEGIYGIREISVTNYDNVYNDFNDSLDKKNNTVKKLSTNINTKNNDVVYTTIFKINKSYDLEYLNKINMMFKGYGLNYEIYISNDNMDYELIGEGYNDLPGLRTIDTNMVLDKDIYYIKIIGNEVDTINVFTKNECQSNCDLPMFSSFLDVKHIKEGPTNFDIYTKTKNIKSGTQLNFTLYDENMNVIDNSINFNENYVVNNFNYASISIEDYINPGKYYIETTYEDKNNLVEFYIDDTLSMKLIVPEPLTLEDKTATINYDFSYYEGVSNFRWSSSNEDVVTIDNEGKIQIHNNGTSTITLTVDTHYGTESITEEVVIYEEIIETVEDFVNMLNEEKRGKTYYLKNDLDFKNYIFDNDKIFYGIFSGGNHKLKNIVIKKTGVDETASIFNSLSNAIIKDLIIEESIFEGEYASSIANYAGNSKIIGVYVNAEINGSYTAAGLVVQSVTNTYEECVNVGKISSINDSSDAYAGGIVGLSFNDVVKNSYNTGEIYAKSNWNKNGYKTAAMAAGITADGWEDAIITNSYNVGNVKAESDISNAVIYTNGLFNSTDYAVSNDSYYLNDDSYTTQIEDASKTREELLNPDTFLSWDISNRWYLDGENYPVLRRFIGTSINVIDIKLDKKDITLKLGETETLIATITPDNATNTNVTWTSSDEEVASVDQNGRVTAVESGTAIITVTSEDGGYTDTCEVTVLDPKIMIGNITFNSRYNNLLYQGYGGTIIVPIITKDIIEKDFPNLNYYKKVGEEYQQITDVDIINKIYISNITHQNNISTLKLGVSSELEIGEYKVEISYLNSNNEMFTFEVLKAVPVSDIEISDIRIPYNFSDVPYYELQYKILPENATNKNVEIITPSDQTKIEAMLHQIKKIILIRGLELGQTTLTIKSLDGSNIEKTINVEVVEKSINLTETEITPNHIYNSNYNEKLYDIDGGTIKTKLTLSNINEIGLQYSLIKIDDNEQTNIINKINVTKDTLSGKLVLNINPNALEAGDYKFKVIGENVYESNEIIFTINEYKAIENVDIKYNNQSIDTLNIFVGRKNVELNGIINETATNKQVEWTLNNDNCSLSDTNSHDIFLNADKVGQCTLTFKSKEKHNSNAVLEKTIAINVIDGFTTVSESTYGSNKGNNTVDVKYGGYINNIISFTNMNEDSELNVEVYEGSNLLGMDYVEKNVFLVNHLAATISLNIIPDKFNYSNEYTPSKELTVKYTYILNDIDNTEVTKEYKVNLSEYNPITKINLSNTDIKLDVNESINISNLISFEPNKATNKEYYVVIDNNNVVKFENNYIKSINEGNTKVTIVSEENENVKTTINVTVEKNDYLEFSNKVNITNESGSKYLKGFNANNTYKDLMNNIDTNLNTVLKESNGTKVTSNSSILKTGMKLSIGDNTYDVVIKGDMSGDGKMSITDLSQMRYHLAQAKGKVKTGAYKQAGDMNDKDGVTITDLSQMRKKLAGVN